MKIDEPLCDTRSCITRRPKEKVPIKEKIKLTAYLALMLSVPILYGTDEGYVLLGIWITVTYRLIMDASKK